MRLYQTASSDTWKIYCDFMVPKDKKKPETWHSLTEQFDIQQTFKQKLTAGITEREDIINKLIFALNSFSS